jgi:phosphoribosylformylglycinamidine synthase
LPLAEENYNIVGKYGYEGYPANPTDLITIRHVMRHTGRHLVMMPHIERSNFQWNWANIRQTETMKFPWHEACQCQKMEKNKFF